MGLLGGRKEAVEGGPQPGCFREGLHVHLIAALKEAHAVCTHAAPLLALTGLTAGQVPGALAAPLDLPVYLSSLTFQFP